LQRIARSNSWIGVTAFGLRMIVRSTVEWFWQPRHFTSTYR
jgi:hypothetical protein